MLGARAATSHSTSVMQGLQAGQTGKSAVARNHLSACIGCSKQFSLLNPQSLALLSIAMLSI